MRTLLLLLLLASREELVPMPEPSLDRASAEVIRAIEAAQSQIESAVSGGDFELARAYGDLAVLYDAHNLEEAASVAYRNAIVLAPEEFRWVYLLGVEEERRGHFEESERLFERALELRPQDLPTLLRLATLDLDNDRLDRVEERVALVPDSTPYSAYGQFLLGSVAAARKAPDKAIEHYLEAMRLQPTATGLNYQLGLAYRTAGDIDSARSRLAQRQGPKVGFPDPVCDVIDEALSGSAGLRILGARAISAGNWDEALDFYSRAAELAPESDWAQTDLAAAMSMAGQTDEAIEQYRLALEVNDENSRTHIALASLLAGQEKGSEALVYYEAAVRLDPEHRDYRHHLARHLRRLGHSESALDHYDHLIEGDTQNAWGRLERAQLLAELGQLERAGADAQVLIGMEGEPALAAGAYNVLAVVALAGGKEAEAVKYLEAGVAESPTDTRMQFTLANLLGMGGRYEEAAVHYRATRDQLPTLVGAWVGEATALSLAGREREAIEVLGEGADHAPEIQNVLARLLIGANDPELRHAERAVAVASKLFREHAEPTYGETLAAALEAVGRLEEAANLRRSLADAVEDPQNEDG